MFSIIFQLKKLKIKVVVENMFQCFFLFSKSQNLRFVDYFLLQWKLPTEKHKYLYTTTVQIVLSGIRYLGILLCNISLIILALWLKSRPSELHLGDGRLQKETACRGF